MDDLSRIERNYGSVAEYNRVMAEKDYEDYEPTLDEQIKSDNEMAVYHAKIKCLNGIPSDFAENLKAEWDEKSPKEEDFENRNQYIYAGYDYSKNKALDVVDKICDHYGVNVDEEWASYYRPGVGKFGISVEYHDGGRIYNKHIGGLDYDTFKDVFRDLHYLGEHPSMSYEMEKDNTKMLSNCSLGNLRISDFHRWGIETDASIEEDLKKAGFNEKAVIKENMKKWERELPEIEDADSDNLNFEL